MKIVLSGGGTLGSVSPLIAIWQELKLKQPNVDALFIGTKKGPEKSFLKQYQILFRSIPAGKLRRYLSFKNLIDPFFLLAGFIKSFFILLKFKPDLIVSAGGFAAVPVIGAGKFLGAKILIHQLDLKPTLSNKLAHYLADRITVTFAKSLNDFDRRKTALAGSLIRKEAKESRKPSLALRATEDRPSLALRATEGRQESPPSLYELRRAGKEVSSGLAGLGPARKQILILGGGTGALSINKLIAEIVPLLPTNLIINHVTGKGKEVEINHPHYHQFEFLTDNYYQKINQADLVISRAGLSTLMELSYLKKPAIIIPLPNTHQEENAKYFADRQAAIYLKQSELTSEMLTDKINNLLNDKEQLISLGLKIHHLMEHGGEKIVAEQIMNLWI